MPSSALELGRQIAIDKAKALLAQHTRIIRAEIDRNLLSEHPKPLRGLPGHISRRTGIPERTVRRILSATLGNCISATLDERVFIPPNVTTGPRNGCNDSE